MTSVHFAGSGIIGVFAVNDSLGSEGDSHKSYDWYRSKTELELGWVAGVAESQVSENLAALIPSSAKSKPKRNALFIALEMRSDLE